MKRSPRVKSFSLNVNLARLRSRHQDIKNRIAAEMNRPAPCGLALQELKRQRLTIKDEIVRCADLLRRHQGQAAQPAQQMSV